MNGNTANDDTEPFPLLEVTDPVDFSATSSSSSASSPASAPLAPLPVGILRQQRRRSSTITGPNPAEVPITDSDYQLAALISRVNLQNALEARSESSREATQPLPFRAAHTETSGESSSETPTSSTQETNRDPIPTISVSDPFTPRHSRNRFSLTLNIDRHLSPIRDNSNESTPTQLALPERSPNIGRSSSRSPARSPLGTPSEEITPTRASTSARSPTENSNNRG